jgi:dipeptidyl aminopeptidase/acylaminoacyl peptidase
MRHRTGSSPFCLTLFGSLLAACAAQAQTPAVIVDPITVEQAMADPDWIGPAVESAWWSWDGRRAYFLLKRTGSTLRDLYAVDSEGRASMAKLADHERANIDAENPVYDHARRHSAFVRNGDLFLRDLRSGALTQITRGVDAVADPRFAADDDALLWRVDSIWYRWGFDSRLVETIAVLKVEKDPETEPNKSDDLRAMQMRLFDTLRTQKQSRDDHRRQDKQLRAADATRAPVPVYLGDDITILSTSLSPDARWLLAVVAPKGADAGRVGKLQKYVTESGYEENEDERTRVGRNTPVGQSLKLIDLRDGSVAELKYDALPGIDTDPLAALRKAAGKDPLKGHRALRVDGIAWSDDGERGALELHAMDNKDRWIVTLDIAAKTLRAAHRLSDPAWVNSSAFTDFGWLPDNRTLWLLSEQSGYSHLYTLVPGQGERERTHGSWETSAPQFSSDGRRAWFVCNRKSPGEYEVCAIDLSSDNVKEVTALAGVEDFQLSPDQHRLLLRYSGSYMPAQLATVSADGGDVHVITDTRTTEYRAHRFLQPRFVQVPSTHGGQPIHAKLYAPAQLESGKRYPIVMFVHGAGYLQNAHSRFPYYFREQMFHNALVQRGYVVLDMDYRGSAGYGRDWRTAIYRQMGHPELDDYLDGVAWMVTNAQGDAQHVGVYGGSYGGFMALMAMFRAPDMFKAGAALRPVTDWTQYNHEYTADILNTPDIDPEAYKASSPIEFADGLRGSLLICHGMLDDNVFFQDSVRLAQRLIELKKTDWSIAPFPLERHSFVQPDAWLDEYRRIFALFERTLK